MVFFHHYLLPKLKILTKSKNFYYTTDTLQKTVSKIETNIQYIYKDFLYITTGYKDEREMKLFSI